MMSKNTILAAILVLLAIHFDATSGNSFYRPQSAPWPSFGSPTVFSSTPQLSPTSFNSGRTSRQRSSFKPIALSSNSRATSQTPSFYVYRYDLAAIKSRPVENQIHPMILARRSLREMSGSPVKDKEMASLYEAARWAPSHFNLQPWRFVAAKRDGPKWNAFLDALTPGNRKWAKDAGVLIVILSNKYQIRKGKRELIPSHSFDTGAAVYAMALEGTARSLVVHPMGGFDREKVAKMIGLDRLSNRDDYQIEAMVAVGNRAVAASRSTEKTTLRNDVNKFVLDGTLEERINTEP